MFEDYLVNEYPKDINDISIEKMLNKEVPIIVFGCGGAGRDITELVINKGGEITSYCEGDNYWFDGKTFLNKPVLNVRLVPEVYKTASIIVAATGPEVMEIITFLEKYGFDIYGYVDRKQLYEMKAEWVFSHSKELNKTYEMLYDDLSKLTFLSFIGARANCINSAQIVPLITLWKSKQYFNSLYPKRRFNEHIFVDCGAWIGDTAEGFINFMQAPNDILKIKCFEMEDDNYSKLVKVAEKYKNIECYKCGVGAKYEKVYFEKKSDASFIVDYPTDNSVEIVSLDEYLKDCKDKITFIKMDIEGYEKNALMGMKKIIKRDMPFLSICVYHKIDDLIEIPKFVREIETESVIQNKIGYKYYLRHHSHNCAELVLYAVPYDIK